MKLKLRPHNEALWQESLRDIDKVMRGEASSYIRVTLPLPADKKEVRAARKAVASTQRAFAILLGVSLETVKAWEAGKRSPEGPATKLIRILKKDPKFSLALAKVA